MADLARLRILAFGLALLGAAAASRAAEPPMPPIDLVAEVKEGRDRTYTTCFDCGESLVSEIEQAISDGSIFVYYACTLGSEHGEVFPDLESNSRSYDAFDPCPRSSCTSFSGDVTR